MQLPTTFPAEAGTQFTDPDGMEEWVIFKSARAGSLTKAAGVRGESVTILPHAKLNSEYVDYSYLNSKHLILLCSSWNIKRKINKTVNSKIRGVCTPELTG
jgi:hypothetical protein